MGARRSLGTSDRGEAERIFLAEGCSTPRSWRNGPGDTYAPHVHPQDKVLFCLEGSIVFHTDAGDLSMDAGDRLDLPAGTRHGATVGPKGCACVEAWGP
jgi:mannose-6-phosphate isomerase-like protein (cupin superfamily)